MPQLLLLMLAEFGFGSVSAPISPVLGLHPLLPLWRQVCWLWLAQWPTVQEDAHAELFDQSHAEYTA